jgi:hypothetical protein
MKTTFLATALVALTAISCGILDTPKEVSAADSAAIDSVKAVLAKVDSAKVDTAKMIIVATDTVKKK